MDENNISEEITIPTIDELKNQNHISQNVEEIEISASDYKKQLNKKVSDFTEEEKQK